MISQPNQSTASFGNSFSKVNPDHYLCTVDGEYYKRPVADYQIGTLLVQPEVYIWISESRFRRGGIHFNLTYFLFEDMNKSVRNYENHSALNSAPNVLGSSFYFTLIYSETNSIKSLQC